MCWGRYEQREEQVQDAEEERRGWEPEQDEELTEVELELGEVRELTPAGR